MYPYWIPLLVSLLESVPQVDGQWESRPFTLRQLLIRSRHFEGPFKGIFLVTPGPPPKKMESLTKRLCEHQALRQNGYIYDLITLNT